jgi:putative ABC transport system permease protein
MSMAIADMLGFSLGAIIRHPLRAGLMLLAIAIGVASIVILTGLGEGARRYVTSEFSSLGTNLLIVIPGKTETTGGVMNIFSGETPRDLTLQDALSLKQHAQVSRIAPVVVGAAYVSWQQLSREAPVLGSNSELLALRNWKMARGRFLPAADNTRGSAVCVIGSKLRQELFKSEDPIGKKIRIGDRQFRVIGTMASEGRSIGVDVEDIVIIPTVSAQSLFNTPSLFRILVEVRSRDVLDQVKQHIIKTIKSRHQGEEDITVISQDAVLGTFDQLFTSLTLTVSGIAAISLTVAGILIMNIMLVTVSQRTTEIGLLKAIGASRHQIQNLFLIEASLLTAAGATLGIAAGYAGNLFIHYLFPALDNTAPVWAILSAFILAVCTGLLFGAMPARRAARLDPIQALTRRQA